MKDFAEVLSMKCIYADGTARTLAEAGLTLDPKVRRISLSIPSASGTLFIGVSDVATDNPSAGVAKDYQLPAGDGVIIDVTHQSAAKLKLKASEAMYVNVQQEGDRA